MVRDRPFGTLQALRCGLFFLLMGLSMVVWTPVVLASRPLPRARRYALALVWLRFQAWILRRVAGLRFDVQGLEHLPPGPAVVLCKHQSMLETFLLPLILPPQTWVLKRDSSPSARSRPSTKRTPPAAATSASNARTARLAGRKSGSRGGAKRGAGRVMLGIV